MKKAVLIMAAAILMGCQDHHFIPYEKADHDKLPKPPERGGQTGGEAPPFARQEQDGQKYVMTDEYREKSAAGEKLIAEGTISLGGGFDHARYGGYVVYLIAWDPDSPRMPVAVEKYDAFQFPIKFRLDQTSLMAGEFPPPGSELKIEARMDADGDVISKEKGDLFGFSRALVPLASQNVNVTLDRERN